MRAMGILVLSILLPSPVLAGDEEHDGSEDEILGEAVATAGPPAPRRLPVPRRPPPPEEKAHLRWTIEGLISLLDGPEGPFGEPTGLPEQLRWDVLDDGEQPGLRVGGRYELNDRNWLEWRYMWVSEDDDRERQTGVFGFSPAPAPVVSGAPAPGGVSPTITGTFQWDAEVHSAEGNWWHAWREVGEARLDSVLGFRLVKLDEDVAAGQFDMDLGNGPAPFVVSRTENLFVGLQAGGGVTYRPGAGHVEFFAAVKALFGALLRDMEIIDQDFFSAGRHSRKLENDDFVLGFDLDVSIRFWIGDRFAVTIGYNLLIVDDVVRAHDAMDFSRADSGVIPPIRRPDELVLHSIFLGVVLDF